MTNLGDLLLDRATRYPDHLIGMVNDPWTLGRLCETALRLSGAFHACGMTLGKRVAVIGHNSMSYVVTWAALQLAGAQTALVNPSYPPELLTQMLTHLHPDGVVWLGRDVVRTVAPASLHLAGDTAEHGVLKRALDGVRLEPDVQERSRAGPQRGDIAGFMHTSGTTGVPKFCAQSHEYFFRLGRFVADHLSLSGLDRVLAPLPLFHINPLGYGLVGSLVGHCQPLFVERFSARRFWADVKKSGATVLVLHAPPIEILKRVTTQEDAKGHRVRAVLYADGGFLEQFQVPLGLSVYGSTEAGGLSHCWTWREGEKTTEGAGISRYGGAVRPDVLWRLNADQIIEVRGAADHVLSSGYVLDGEVVDFCSSTGWFETGDLGRKDLMGNLVFIERAAESIKVKGEYVPITFVEDQFRQVEGLGDFAIWRRRSTLVDDEVLLYTDAAAIPIDEIRAVSARLPAFMRPLAVVQVPSISRDSGVGKVRRRLLNDATATAVVKL